MEKPATIKCADCRWYFENRGCCQGEQNARCGKDYRAKTNKNEILDSVCPFDSFPFDICQQCATNNEKEIENENGMLQK